MEGVKKYVLLGAEMGQFWKAVIDADQQAKDQAEDQQGNVEAGLGVGGGQESLHAI